MCGEHSIFSAHCLLNHLRRCLAHIINLATQALLGEYSKSLHYDPTNPDVELAASSGPRHDEIGLVRSISVKVRGAYFHCAFADCRAGTLICEAKGALQGDPVE